MSNDTKVSRIFLLVLFLSNSCPKTKDDCISFLDINKLESKASCTSKLNQKLTYFLNQDNGLETYSPKEKRAILQSLCKACKSKETSLGVNKLKFDQICLMVMLRIDF
jgi:hypothetical protein